jgi:hypothetical protein
MISAQIFILVRPGGFSLPVECAKYKGSFAANLIKQSDSNQSVIISPAGI